MFFKKVLGKKDKADQGKASEDKSKLDTAQIDKKTTSKTKPVD